MSKKPMGRPPLKPGEAKSAVFQIRLTDAERASYEQAAQRAGVSLAAWMRERLNKAAKRESK